MASDFVVKQEDFEGSYKKIQLKNGKEVDFEAGLKKDKTYDADGNVL